MKRGLGKFVRCAKCDENIELSLEKLLCPNCGNPIAGYCREHKVLYDLNALPTCPVCIRKSLTDDSRKKLKQLIEKAASKIVMITEADNIRIKTESEPKEFKAHKSPSSVAYVSKDKQPMSEAAAAKLANGTTWV